LLLISTSRIGGRDLEKERKKPEKRTKDATHSRYRREETKEKSEADKLSR